MKSNQPTKYLTRESKGVALSTDGEIKPDDYEEFVVIGYYYNTTRPFRQVYPSTMAGAMTAMAINLWRGRVWGVLKATGKRALLKEVFN